MKNSNSTEPHQNARDCRIKANRFDHFQSKVIRRVYLHGHRILARLSRKRKISILFSPKQDWQTRILEGFRFTPHDVIFSDFSPELIEKHSLVIPLTIPALKYLHTLPHLHKENPIPIPTAESVQLCDEKPLFNQRLMATGFAEYIPRMGRPLTYPYMLKKREDAWGRNCHVIMDCQTEKHYAEKLEDPDYFTQEIVTGPTEYATHILFKDQKIIRSLNLKYVFDTDIPIKGQNKFIYMKICRSPYSDLFASILREIGFEGLCCVNYKVRDNKPMILEINPRCGASLCPYLFSFVQCAI
jgi:hypothetical protein